MESQPQNPEFRINPENFTHVMCLAQGHKVVMLVRLEPTTPL